MVRMLKRMVTMNRIVTMVAGLGVLATPLSSPPALAQDIVKQAKASLADLPGWKIPDICAKDSAAAHCLALESRAWRAVSGSWVSLPDAVKAVCIGNAKGAGDESWRVLGDCIDEEMEKRADKRAVATRYTPSEAVPPPKPAAQPIAAAAKIDVPPPIIPFSPAPPPFALDAEAEAKRKVDAEAAAKAAVVAAEARRRAEADAKRLADEAAAKAAAEQAEAKRKAEADAKRLADEAAARTAAEVAEKKRIADAEAAAIAAKRAEAAAAAKVCEDKLAAVAAAGPIRFRISSATIDQASNATLDQLADVVKSCPGNAIRVEGHTDNQGQQAFNMDLSRNRAQAVVEHLVRAGVAAELIVAEGFGDTRPMADNAAAEGRAQNRRIEFKVEPR